MSIATSSVQQVIATLERKRDNCLWYVEQARDDDPVRRTWAQGQVRGFNEAIALLKAVVAVESSPPRTYEQIRDYVERETGPLILHG